MKQLTTTKTILQRWVSESEDRDQLIPAKLFVGTPVQNNMRDLFGIMNLLNPDKWSYEEDFFELYGGGAEVSTVEQIRALQVRTKQGSFKVLNCSSWISAVPMLRRFCLDRCFLVMGRSKAFHEAPIITYSLLVS